MSDAALSWRMWALLSAVFAAATALLAKVAVARLPADLATLLRTLVVLALLTAVVTATRQWPALTSIGPRTALALVASGLATGLSWLCYFRALRIGEASRVAPIDKLSVVFVALFAALFLGERPTPAAWAGVACIAGGAALVASGR